MLKFNNILVHYDSRRQTHPGLECAAELARANNGRMKIVSMIPDFNWLTRKFLGGYERVIEDITHAKTDELELVAVSLRAQGIDVSTAVLDGRTSVAMIREVLRNDHDLVIKEAKGQHSRSGGFFGTTATRLLRKCPCPVLILKPDRPCRADRVLAAVTAMPDDDVHAKLNGQVLELAAQAVTSGSPDVVSAWSAYGESILKNHMSEDEFDELEQRTEQHATRRLNALLKALEIQVGDANVHLLHGDAGELVPHCVREHDVDLLVMGTVARSGIAGMLTGNIAEQILDRVECSVLAIKPEGFVSPIRL